jgi:hypothetical protein
MNKCIYKFGMRVDQYGERISSNHNGTARCVSGDCMYYMPTTGFDEDNSYVDKYGNWIPKPEPPRLIPVNELHETWYF